MKEQLPLWQIKKGKKAMRREDKRTSRLTVFYNQKGGIMLSEDKRSFFLLATTFSC